MTQTPQLPPNDPEPLDAAERELAQMLRNLPSGSPPPELDARILGAARRAVHQARPRKLSWWRSIGMGTAASALVAAGLFLKMHGAGQDGQIPMPTSEPAADMATPSAHMTPPPVVMPAHAIRSPLPPPQVEPAAADEEAAPMATPPPPKAIPPPPVVQDMPVRMSAPTPMPAAIPAPVAPVQPVDIGTLAGKPATNAFPEAQTPERGRERPAGLIEPPPPPPPLPAPPIVRQEPMPTLAPAPRDVPNQPAAAATTVNQGALEKDEFQAAKKSAQAAGGVANQASSSSTNPSSSDAGSAAAGPADATDGAKAKNLDTVSVTGSRVRRVDTETASPVVVLDRKSTWLPRVDYDSRLAPAPWLDRIRARIKAGDDANARESLRRFHVRYPDAAIPDDLQPLLR